MLFWVRKILDRAIYTHLVDFANSNSLLSQVQFGFRAGMRTVDAVMKLTEFIYSSSDKKSYALGVFADLRKAFDTVSHHVLLQKLYLYGIRGLPHTLLWDYLTNRVQSVRFGNVISNSKIVGTGVPRGSV